MQSTTRRALLQDIELMPQDHDFGFQPLSRLAHRLRDDTLFRQVIDVSGDSSNNRGHSVTPHATRRSPPALA